MRLKFDGITDPEELGQLLKKFMKENNLKELNNVTINTEFIDEDDDVIKFVKINGKMPQSYYFYKDEKGITHDGVSNFTLMKIVDGK